MIRIFILGHYSGKLFYDITASQYCYCARDETISFRMNHQASTIVINCMNVSIDETAAGNIHISAYMTEEEIRKFETRF